MNGQRPPWLFQKYTFPNVVVGVLVLLFGVAFIVGCFVSMPMERLTMLGGIFGGLSAYFVKGEKKEKPGE